MAFNAYYTNYEPALANTWFVAKTVYPELFADIDIAAKTDEITEMFPGETIADEIFACPLLHCIRSSLTVTCVCCQPRASS